jgi:RHS repeat-associated protein
MPFGEELYAGIGGRTSDSGQRYSSNADDIRQKFTGYQKDAETNFDFAEARMYENRYGRFTAVDPLIASGKSVNPQTFNRYIYVGNNPLAFVDPTGLIWGTAADGRVRWFDKKLGKGFTEFKPDNWQYIGNDKKLYELDSNSSKWHEIKPVQVFAEDNPIQTLATSVSDTFDESLIGAAKGGGNFAINTWNFATQPGSSSGAGLGIPNPFEVAPYTYDNATQWKFGTATETGLTVAPLFAAAQFSPSGVPSVVPQTARVGQFEVGTFSVIDWTGYPKGYSRPSGIFRLLQGEEYTNARILASKTNRTLRSENPGMFEGAHIHEIKPVKFGGSPTNPANKISIPRSVHEQQFTPWWNRLQRDLQQ